MDSPFLRWYTIHHDIQVDCVEHVKESSIHPTRILAFWVLVIMNSGVRTFCIYDEEVCVGAGEFFILPPYVPHSGLRVDEHDAAYVHFAATGHEVDQPKKIDAGRILLPQRGKIPNDTDIQQLMQYAANHYMSPFSNNSFLNAQVISILYQISYYQQRFALWKGKNINITEKITQFIRDNMATALSKEDYENAFGITYRRLNYLFAQSTGKTIKQMQMQLRINQAKYMLSTGYSINETCSSCGFSDYYYFIKAFHKATDMTPKEYRKAAAYIYPINHDK